MGYDKTIWEDGENKYDIKSQNDSVINSDVKFVYKGASGTPVSSEKMNKIESGIYDASPPGEVKYFARKTAPVGYLKADGSAVSRTTYADLFDAICPAQNFTVTIASPAVFSATGHGLSAGDPVRFATTGALPTGLSTNTTYYVISAGLTADAFQVSTSLGGAAVNTSGSQNGTHTLRPFYYGVGDGSSTFNLPDLRGVFVRGLDDGKGYDTDRVFGSYQADDNKAHTHTGTTNDDSHTHTFTGYPNQLTGGGGSGPGYSTIFAGNTTTSQNTHSHTFTTNSTGATEVKVKNIALLACIRY